MPGIGTLLVGALEGDIESVTFEGGHMLVNAVFERDLAGDMRGEARIIGTDGKLVWLGAHFHDYGRKPVMSTWKVSIRITEPPDGARA